MKVTFRGVIPRQIKAKEMRFQLLNGLRLVRTEMIRQFELTTESWEHEVEFVGSQPSLAKGIPTISVETDDEVYRIVNDGARPHPIFPNGDYPLFFHSEYAAKTAPGVIDSWDGGAGEKDTFADHVNHPGFPARDFDITVKEGLQQFFEDTMRDAMVRAAEASGWAI